MYNSLIQYDIYKYTHEIIISLLVFVLIVVVYFFSSDNSFSDNLFDTMKIYYINLDRSKERMNNVERICSEHDLVSERIVAIDGKKLNIDDEIHQKSIQNIKWWFKKNNMQNIGHFGCYLSHMKTYEKFLNSNSEYCLILEDDVEFLTSNLKNDIIKNMNNLPKDWNILLLGYEIDSRNKSVKKGNKDTKLKNGLLNIKYFVGLHAYIINRETAKILLKELQVLDWILDWNISFLANKNKLNIYGVYPPIACQPAIHMIDVNDIYHEYKCSNSFPTLTNK